MSGIQNFIEKICVETCVYWSPGTLDKYGRHKYNAVEIPCRWEEKFQKVLNKENQEVLSRAKIISTKELDVNGFLSYTSLELLNEEEKKNPLLTPWAFPIIAMERIPELKSKEDFVFVYYL